MADYIKWIRERVGHDRIFLVFATACVTNENGEVLLQRRGDDGKWGLLGGALELGESAAEAAVREAREESGLDVRVKQLVGVYTKYEHEYASGDKTQPVVICFECEATGDSGSYDKNETLELRYFGRDEIPELSNQQHRDMVDDFFSGKRGNYR